MTQKRLLSSWALAGLLLSSTFADNSVMIVGQILGRPCTQKVERLMAFINADKTTIDCQRDTQILTDYQKRALVDAGIQPMVAVETTKSKLTRCFHYLDNTQAVKLITSGQWQIVGLLINGKSQPLNFDTNPKGGNLAYLERECSASFTYGGVR